jgi:adenosylcobinamide-GDP ribazoletransferase
VPRIPLGAGLLGGVALLVAWELPAGPVVAVAAALVATATVALARRRIGGFTGDVIGAAGVLAETAGLVVAAAKW